MRGKNSTFDSYVDELRASKRRPADQLLKLFVQFYATSVMWVSCSVTAQFRISVPGRKLGARVTRRKFAAVGPVAERSHGCQFARIVVAVTSAR